MYYSIDGDKDAQEVLYNILLTSSSKEVLAKLGKFIFKPIEELLEYATISSKLHSECSILKHKRDFPKDNQFEKDPDKTAYITDGNRIIAIDKGSILYPYEYLVTHDLYFNYINDEGIIDNLADTQKELADNIYKCDDRITINLLKGAAINNKVIKGIFTSKIECDNHILYRIKQYFKTEGFPCEFIIMNREDFKYLEDFHVLDHVHQRELIEAGYKSLWADTMIISECLDGPQTLERGEILGVSSKCGFINKTKLGWVQFSDHEDSVSFVNVGIRALLNNEGVCYGTFKYMG